MDLLKRQLAPILDEAWAAIDEETKSILELHLAGRRIVDVSGPHGWDFAAVNTGELELVDWQPVDGIHAGMRGVQRLLELRTPVRIPIMELDNIGRGAKTPNLAGIAAAAERMAQAEDGAIFNGLDDAGITGILRASPHEPIQVAGVGDYPEAIRSAMSLLANAGVQGPYALALGPKAYDLVFTAIENGYPVVKQITRQILGGPIVRAPALEGGLVVSVRGGDYELTLGQDLSVGYAHHDRDEVELYLAESFTFRVLEPSAAVALVRG